jgi:hypothetical protein
VTEPIRYCQVEIGNGFAIEAIRDPLSGEIHYEPIEGERVTTVLVPESYSLMEAVAVVQETCRREMAEGAKPAWIETSSDGLQTLLLEQFGLPKTARKRPASWGKDDHPVVAYDEEGAVGVAPKKATRARKAVAKKAAASPTLMALTLPFYALALFALTRMQLRTNAGRDWQSRVMGDPASTGTGSYAPGSWMGLTADNAAPNAANTTLPGEIAVGTLARKVCAYSHTNGTASYALTAVFTFDQNITINKFGIFNALAGGTLVFETLLNAAVIGQIGDQTTVTETVTI